MSDQEILKLKADNANLQKRLEALEAKYASEIKDLKEEIKAYKADLDMLKSSNIGGLRTCNPWTNLNKKITDPVQVAVINTVPNDIKEREVKANNIVVFGLNELEQGDIKAKTAHDKMQMANILLKIGVKVNTSDIVKTVRVASNPNKPKLLVVKFNNHELRDEVIRNAKQLKLVSELKNVYINPDLTIAERQKLKELIVVRNEKNDSLDANSEFYYGIRGGKLVKLPKQKRLSVDESNVTIRRSDTTVNSPSETS
jgi:hypothetical protein